MIRYVRHALPHPNIIFFLLTSLLLFILQFVHTFITNLAFERLLIENHEYWRLLTGGLVHANLPHLILNLVGLFLLLTLYENQIATRIWCAISLLQVFCVNLTIYLMLPSTEFYLGFSGGLHGLYSWYSVIEWRRKHSWFPVCVLVVLFIKLGMDSMSANSISTQIIGMNVHWQSHWIGAITGILLALIYKRKAA